MGDMRRSCLVLIIVFSSLLLLQIGCEEQAKVVEKPVPAGREEGLAFSPKTAEAAPKPERMPPKITFEKVVHDFGEIGPGTKNYGSFKFSNTGGELLKIKDIERCCGIVAKIEKNAYAPGESGILKVEYTATRSPGLVMKKLYVNSNDISAPKFALTVKADVIQKVIWQPKRLNLLLGEENASCPEITLSSVDNQPFSIKFFKSTLDCISADVDTSVKAAKFVLQPKVDMEKLQQTMRGNVYIGLTHPDCEGIGIGFDVLAKFKVDPPLLIVFYAEQQQPIKRYIWIHNNYKEDFEIESTSSKEGFIKVVNQKKIRKSYQLDLEITPPIVAGKEKFLDELYVNIKGGERLRVVCRGIYSGKKQAKK
jgi:hypothetical protein